MTLEIREVPTEGSASLAGVGAHLRYPEIDISKAYRYYVVAMVWLVLLFRFLDLQIIGVLLESIRTEFRVSDTQLGLLSGTAFAIFYVALGLPIAWLADRYDRRNIMAICLGLWSAMTAVCGLATSFAGLFLARIGVGVGEAGGQPPAYSLISSLFPPSRRSTIFAILSSSIPAGVFVGYLIGGYLNVSLGWRATFALLGLAGVLVALLVRFTVREPAREKVVQRAGRAAPRIGETLRYLWNLRSYRQLVLATSIATLGSMGAGVWIAAFFIRVHGMPALQVTTWLAFIYGGGGLVGALLGGMFADRLTRKFGDARWQVWIPAAVTLAVVPASPFVYLWPVATVALIALTGVSLLTHGWLGSAYGTVQTIAGPQRRAFASAINMLCVNLLAMGLGPLIVGAASDYFKPLYGEQSLRYSILAVVVVCYTWAAIHFLLAARTLRGDLRVALAQQLYAPAGE